MMQTPAGGGEGFKIQGMVIKVRQDFNERLQALNEKVEGIRDGLELKIEQIRNEEDESSFDHAEDVVLAPEKKIETEMVVEEKVDESTPRSIGQFSSKSVQPFAAFKKDSEVIMSHRDRTSLLGSDAKISPEPHKRNSQRFPEHKFQSQEQHHRPSSQF